MKYAVILAIVLSGCAAKKPVAPQIEFPKECKPKVVLVGNKCKPVGQSQWECEGKSVVTAGCYKYVVNKK